MTAAVTDPMQAQEVAATSSPYIVGAVYDWCLFLLPPAAALVLGIVISETFLTDRYFHYNDRRFTWSLLGIGAFIHAHLILVFIRSHGNRTIYETHPYRFIAAPLALLSLMLMSPWILIGISVLATFWDVYHSALQTFGFARIYDRKLGNDPRIARRLDWWLNQLLYAGPIVGGASMLAHFDDFREFELIGSALFSGIPVFMEGHQQYFTWAILGIGAAYIVYYVVAHLRLSRQGYRISPLKVYLLASTGAVSIYAWGFNPFGQAYFIMNFFHALQYFGIVWAFERKNLQKLTRVRSARLAKVLALALLIVPAAGYGLWVQSLEQTIHSGFAVTLVVSIMHFWYDGFIWSVQKHQV